MGSSDTPVLRTGNSPGRTIPSAVMPRNSSRSDSRARTSMRCRNSEYFGGGSYAGIGRRRRRGGGLRGGRGGGGGRGYVAVVQTGYSWATIKLRGVLGQHGAS